MILQNLPVLLVVLPLLGGLLAAFLGTGRTPWMLSMAVSAAVLVMTIMTCNIIYSAPGTVISYAIGWWPTQWGIEYRIDAANALLLLVLSVIGFASTLYARHAVARELKDVPSNLFYALWSLAQAGLYGITVTGDAFNVYVLLEISSLTVYTLIALSGTRDRVAYLAALRYLIIGSTGATLFLLGLGYMLMLTGTLNMADIHEQLLAMHQSNSLTEHRGYLAGVAFILTGLAIKMAAYPLHGWLAGAYSKAPDAVTSLLSGTATKVGVYVTLRFLYTVLVHDAQSGAVIQLLSAFACIAVVHTSLQAFQTTDLKRIFALSSVGQLAYIILGFCIGTRLGITAALFQLAVHAMAKSSIFMGIGMMRASGLPPTLKGATGLARRRPAVAAIIGLGCLSLIGVPLTAGFVAKWLLVSAAWQTDNGLVIGFSLAGGVLAIIYSWRIIEAMFLKEPVPQSEPLHALPLDMVAPALVLSIIGVYTGIFPGWLQHAAQAAADAWLISAGGLIP